MERKFTIQETATRTGLSVHTLRYYETIGLIQGVARCTNGYREYSELDVAWIEFLVRLRETGMPIQQMIRFSELRYNGEETIPARRQLLESLEEEVEEKISILKQNLASIRTKIDLYKEWENDGSIKK